jgi:hypothetical protein
MLYSALENESIRKDQLSMETRQKMKYLQDIADDGIWGLQERLCNETSILFLEKQKNEELENDLHVATQKLKAAFDEIENHKTETTAKLKIELDLSKIKIIELECENSNLKQHFNSKRVLKSTASAQFSIDKENVRSVRQKEKICDVKNNDEFVVFSDK